MQMDHKLEEIIMKRSTNNSTTSLFRKCRMEAIEFIHCINRLHKTMHQMVAGELTNDSQKMLRCQFLMQIASKKLQNEFFQLLSLNRSILHPRSVSVPPTEDDDAVELSIHDIHHDSTIIAMENLRLTAECMISSGYAKECIEIYRVTRKSVIDEGIYNLGVDKFDTNHIHKVNVGTWKNAVTMAMKTLFAGERILCNYVFASSGSIREWCFSQVVKDGAIILFQFPEKLIKHSKKTKGKVLEALDMYSVVSDNLPEIDSIFSSNLTMGIKSQATKSLDKLAEFVCAAVDKFESSVLRDSSVAEGIEIHDLTIYSMDYLTNLADYNNILPEILADYVPPANKSLPKSYFTSSGSPALSMKLAWLILALLCKLDSKSCHCKDVSSKYVFLANNTQYIIRKVRTSKLRNILGEEWITKQEMWRQKMAPRGRI